MHASHHNPPLLNTNHTQSSVPFFWKRLVCIYIKKEHYSNFGTFEISSLPNVPGHYLRKYGDLLFIFYILWFLIEITFELITCMAISFHEWNWCDFSSDFFVSKCDCKLSTYKASFPHEPIPCVSLKSLFLRSCIHKLSMCVVCFPCVQNQCEFSNELFVK